MKFELSNTVSRIDTSAGKVDGVTLSSGVILATHMVLLTAGVRPNTELARNSGIACDRGIIVDQKLSCDCDSVYALGECCQIENQLFGLVAPVYQQAAVLAQQLTQQGNQRYVHRDTAVQLKVAGVTVSSGGLLPFPEHAKSQILVDRKNHVYRRLVFDKTRLIGFVLIGDAQHKASYESSLDSGGTISGADSNYMFAAKPSMNTSIIPNKQFSKVLEG
jgi:nitrite reductase (NADH) large subunit